MNDLSLMGGYAITLVTAAFIPGPGMTGLMFKALSQGHKNSLIMLTGLITGDLCFLLLAIFGMNILSQWLNHQFTSVLVGLACVYLLYLAYSFWNTKTDLSQSIHSYHPKRSAYLDGLLITLSNPKTISFYFALLPSFFSATTIKPQMLLAIVYITVLTLLVVGSFYIFSAVKMQQKIKNPKFQHHLLKASAVLMSFCAISLLWLEIFKYL